METLVAAPQREQLRSFDILASVDMFKFDLQVYGYVLPETRQRVFDEELTYIAEGLNRPLHTTFNLKEQGGKLVYFDRGEWRPYTGTLITGFETAQEEALHDPRKQFQAERAQKDLYIGYQLEKLKPGEKMQWYSPYPHKEAALYGDDFVSSLGYQPKRQMGFLYQATRHADGSVDLDSQSVDNSHDDAFEAAMLIAEKSPQADIEIMRNAYDQVLSAGREQAFFAGQAQSEAAAPENAWETLRQHRDLIDYYLANLEALAATNDSRHETERSKKRLTYGVWAALKERMDRGALSINQAGDPSLASLQREINQAYQVLSARGEVLFGCGGALKGEEALLNADSNDVFDAVFGEKSSERLVWKDGICRIEGCPTRPGKTKVAQCSVCKGCQAWFDRGRDPSKLYKGLRSAQRESVTVSTLGKRSTKIKKGEKA